MSIRTRRPDLPRVIVRSFASEPVVLVAHGLDKAKQRVLVGLEHAKRPISLPFADVFDYDPARFAELEAAFTAKDKHRLDEIYSSLGRNNACNRYQNMISLQHEKEPEISNSRGAANSGQQRSRSREVS